MDVVDQLVLNISKLIIYSIVPIIGIFVAFLAMAVLSKNKDDNRKWVRRAKVVVVIFFVLILVQISWTYLLMEKY